MPQLHSTWSQALHADATVVEASGPAAPKKSWGEGDAKSTAAVYAEADAKARAAYKTFDVDGNKMMDLYECMSAMKELGIAVTYDEGKACFDRIDTDGGGSIEEVSSADLRAISGGELCPKFGVGLRTVWSTRSLLELQSISSARHSVAPDHPRPYTHETLSLHTVTPHDHSGCE